MTHPDPSAAPADAAPAQGLAALVRAWLEPSPCRRFAGRHRDVLLAAMELIAQRGFAAASLRELARRVSISQPSLYHYFESKDALIEQIVEAYSAEIFEAPTELPRITSLEDALRYSIGRIRAVYEDPRHADFVRFMFTVAIEKPRFRELLRDFYTERAIRMVTALLRCVGPPGRVRPEDVEPLAEMAINAVVLRFINEHVLRVGTSSTSADTFVDFVIDTAVRGASARAAAPSPASEVS